MGSRCDAGLRWRSSKRAAAEEATGCCGCCGCCCCGGGGAGVGMGGAEEGAEDFEKISDRSWAPASFVDDREAMKKILNQKKKKRERETKKISLASPCDGSAELGMDLGPSPILIPACDCPSISPPNRSPPPPTPRKSRDPSHPATRTTRKTTRGGGWSFYHWDGCHAPPSRGAKGAQSSLE